MQDFNLMDMIRIGAALMCFSEQLLDSGDPEAMADGAELRRLGKRVYAALKIKPPDEDPKMQAILAELHES